MPKSKVDGYKNFSKKIGDFVKKHGALEYVDCIADDVKPGKQTSFPQAVQLGNDETVMLSWAVYEFTGRPRPGDQGHDGGTVVQGHGQDDAGGRKPHVHGRLQGAAGSLKSASLDLPSGARDELQMYVALQVLTVILAAVTMALSLAHALEFPGKLRASRRSSISLSSRSTIRALRSVASLSPAVILATVALLIVWTPCRHGGVLAGRRGPCGAGHGPGHLLDQDQPANGFWLEETEGLAARRPASFRPAGEALHAAGRPRVISGSARTYCAHCPARTMQLALEDLKSERRGWSAAAYRLMGAASSSPVATAGPQSSGASTLRVLTRDDARAARAGGLRGKRAREKIDGRD